METIKQDIRKILKKYYESNTNIYTGFRYDENENEIYFEKELRDYFENHNMIYGYDFKYGHSSCGYSNDFGTWCWIDENGILQMDSVMFEYV